MDLFYNFIYSCFILLSIFRFDPTISIERAFPVQIYQIRKHFDPQALEPKKTYGIVLLGDSMTEFLGSAFELEADLKNFYPGRNFNILNYGYGSTNILSVPDRLQNLTNHGGVLTPPILNRDFDLILIESFGNNPLSNLPLQKGLQAQNQTLDQIIKMIHERKPDVKIVFIATLAPIRERYGEGIVNLSTKDREKWADERSAYIRNHIKYANSHNIPLVDIYDKTYNFGHGNMDYINSGDFIHPSPTGILFISQQIANYIFRNRVFPL